MIKREALAARTLHFRRAHNGNHASRRNQMTTDTEVTIRELDQTWSSLVEIDSHALQRVVGGVIPGGGGGGATSPAKPQLGRTKRILCGLGMLGCAILGPDRP